jgi:hypothetical protein
MFSIDTIKLRVTTMTKKSKIHYYASENVLEEFYKALASDRLPSRLVHIPRSDVFYLRQKYYKDTGHYVTLDRMERAMYHENMLSKRDVLDPERKRDWE